jgi:GIY-YIG catalytic domain
MLGHGVKFGMSSTLLTFIDKYYEYDGDKDPEEKGLTIGGYESAWLADLVGAYILANTQQHFNETKYYGLYRDDGIGVFKGQWSYEKIVHWRNNFQKAVNKLAGGSYLQFTCNIWMPSPNSINLTEVMDNNVTAERKETFPYLDMELKWATNKKLSFQVHLKPNQQLKYLNKGSAHTNACFKAIPAGVYHRLTKLTSMDENNADKCLEDIYPEHFKALRRANLITNKIPTLREEMSRVEEKLEQKRTKTREDESKKKREDLRKRSTFFCVGYSKAWITPIHKLIKEIKERFKLSWLRVSMSYHRFSNLREVFQGDLSKKLTLDVKSKDFETLECNCRLGSEKRCGYDNMCRKSIIVYKVECKETSKIYIGNTQQYFKKRMQQHFNDVKKLHTFGEKSDSYAKHFAMQLSNLPTTTPQIQRESIRCSVLWQGNPISVVKTFGTPNCALCNKERIEILKQSKKDSNSLINSCNEIYGACRHKPKFHRYVSRTPSTDESNEDERVTLDNFTEEGNIWCGECLTEV